MATQTFAGHEVDWDVEEHECPHVDDPRGHITSTPPSQGDDRVVCQTCGVFGTLVE